MNPNRSWLSLVTLCTGASLAAALALAMVFTAASLVAAAPATAAAEEPNTSAQQHVFSGVISDYQCDARHNRDSDKSPAECTLACIRKGGKFSLVNGDKKYVLEGKANELSRWAGQRVAVAGTLSGDTIKVISIGNPRKSSH